MRYGDHGMEAFGGDVPGSLAQRWTEGGSRQVIAQAELAWPAERLALCLDLLDSEQAALAEEGWTVLHADSGSTGWPRRVLAQLKERFGIGEDTLAEDAP